MHDYDPAWDYPSVELEHLTRVPERVRQAVAAAVERVAAELPACMGFAEARMEVFYVAINGLDGDTVGRFCEGTSQCPVIGVDVETIVEAVADEMRMNRALYAREGESDEDLLARQVGLEVAVTLAHELGHAWHESVGLDLESIGAEQERAFEDAVEAFARTWQREGWVDLDGLAAVLPADLAELWLAGREHCDETTAVAVPSDEATSPVGS